MRDAAFLAEPRDAAVWRISTAPMKGPEVSASVAAALPARWFYDWGGGLIWLACGAAGALRAINGASRGNSNEPA